jgi:hypothetical protein
MTRKALLVCGILSSLLYLTMVVFVPMLWDGYSTFSQSVSELSAIDAPTRPIWVLLGAVYTLLVIAFGWGVWSSAGRTWTLRVVGGLLIAHAIFALAWPPMHQRAVLAANGGTLTDTLHLVWAMVVILLMMLEIGFGAASFGKRFRLFSLATMVALVGFGGLTGLAAPEVQSNLPTPWTGVWQRINIAAYLSWMIVLAVTLLRGRDAALSTSTQETLAA